MNTYKDEFNHWAKANYLDASAIVKLLIDMPEEKDGREALLSYFNNNAGFHTTSLCFAEALGVLKVKHFRKKQIKEETYIKAFEKLIWSKIEIDDVPIGRYDVLKEAKRLIQSYRIDLSDAMQVVTIKMGKYSVLDRGSKSILITADNALAKAARKEGVRVWNCLVEPSPQ